jgi:hypothetical protein
MFDQLFGFFDKVILEEVSDSRISLSNCILQKSLISSILYRPPSLTKCTESVTHATESGIANHIFWENESNRTDDVSAHLNI